jgi:hypothetical protein
MSRALSPSFARCYGLARVARVWTISRASVYRSLKKTPPNTITRRPGPVGACSDAELAEWSNRGGVRHPGPPARMVAIVRRDAAEQIATINRRSCD